MWFERHIAGVLKTAFNQFPALVLTGARQVGKTSLVRRLFPRASYVSFDLPSNAEEARLDPDAFFQRHGEPLAGRSWIS